MVVTMKNEARRGRTDTTRRNYYIDGNTVRKTEAVPAYTREEQVRREHRERIEREREEEQRRRRHAARRNQEKALRMSRSYVVFLSMAVLIFGAFAGLYIRIQSDVTARMIAISSLESEVSSLKADNDEAYKRINTALDLDSIRNLAMLELGMGYARESQIVYYSVGDDDYMNQYGEIPEK